MDSVFIVYWCLVAIYNPKLFCFFFFYAIFFFYGMQMLFPLVVFLPLGRAFGWLCLLPTIIVVYVTIVQVNAFHGLLGNRCIRS